MPEPKPNPTRDANGLPLCNEDDCALYDGKRCRALGFRPDRFCEPALVEIVEGRDALRVLAAETMASPAPTVGGSTLFFSLPENAGLPGRGVLVEWGDGGVSAGLDGGPFVSLPTGHEETPEPTGRYGWPIGPDGFTRVSCDRERTGEYPCPGCGQPAGAKCARPVKIAATTIEQAPPEDLLDRITPEGACRHRRVSLRPDPHGNPETTCLDCGEPTNT